MESNNPLCKGEIALVLDGVGAGDGVPVSSQGSEGAPGRSEQEFRAADGQHAGDLGQPQL
jgi:hypothetical protein